MKKVDLKERSANKENSWFAWVQLVATLSIPLAIAIYTVMQDSSVRSIALATRHKDLEIAAENRAKDERLADDQQKENILVEYQSFLLKILLDNNTNLDMSASVSLVLRLKTLAALRQLSPARRTFLLYSLFEAKLITTTRTRRPAVSLRSANLTGVDFSSQGNLARRQIFDCLALEWTIMNNVSFRSALLYGSIFLDTELNFADFTISEV
jgi:uncharacterized protein YjbI with pentapeptide repeats